MGQIARCINRRKREGEKKKGKKETNAVILPDAKALYTDAFITKRSVGEKKMSEIKRKGENKSLLASLAK